MANTYSPTRGPLAGREFASQQAYQNQLARERGFSSYAAMRKQGEQRWQPWESLQHTFKRSLNRPAAAGYQKITKTGYERHVRATRKEFRTAKVDVNRPHGALARLLEYLGLRVPGAEHRVGETRELTGKAA